MHENRSPKAVAIMGFASYVEDIVDRFNDAAGLLTPYTSRPAASSGYSVGSRYALTGNAGHAPSPSNQRDKLLQELRRAASEFLTTHSELHRYAGLTAGEWGRHFDDLKELHDILLQLGPLKESQPEARTVIQQVEQRLDSYCRERKRHGVLSRFVADRIRKIALDILAVSSSLREKLVRFTQIADAAMRQQLEDDTLLKRVHAIVQQVQHDADAFPQYQALTDKTLQLWSKFLSLRAAIALNLGRRPALEHLTRLELHENQDRLVELDHQGAYRVTGVSGTGKTLILLHRAIRLAREDTSARVYIFTINRSLATLLENQLKVLCKGNLPNVFVLAFYDFLLSHLEDPQLKERFRLIDPASGETVDKAWYDFTHHPSTNPDVNVFSYLPVRTLLAKWGRRREEALAYLRDELIYIQTGYAVGSRPEYLSEARKGRVIPLNSNEREACIEILEAWEEYCSEGEVADEHLVSLAASKSFLNQQTLEGVRSKAQARHILLDEMQDFSTLELTLVRSLMPDPEIENGLFLVGDHVQKVSAKHHMPARPGFRFQGRSEQLRKNWRNTREILVAAYKIVERRPPRYDDLLEVIRPELSPYRGEKPVVVRCSRDDHAQFVCDMVTRLFRQKGCRVAVVSESDRTLDRVRERAAAQKLPLCDVYKIADWHDAFRTGASRSITDSRCVIGRMDAVKGYEFDAVIACDVSEGVIPSDFNEVDEYWREAAVLYAALTRARERLIITYIDSTSQFLEDMYHEVIWKEKPTEREILQVMGLQ
jgi:superfamily I DNA/RNA helicase